MSCAAALGCSVFSIVQSAPELRSTYQTVQVSVVVDILNDEQASGLSCASAGIADLCFVALLQEFTLRLGVEEDAAVRAGLRHHLDL